MLRPLLIALALAGSPGAQDVLIFVLDDVAAADLALYGGPVVLPALEALAQRGVTFERAYANPTCAPSRRSLFTGHWWLTGNGASCTDASEPSSPPASEWMLPEMLPGHQSALVGKWHLGASPVGRRWECAALDQGFDRWLAGSAANVQSCGGQNYTSWMKVELCRERREVAYEPLVVTEAALGFLAEPGGPKLTVVCTNLAHEPFHRPPEELLPVGYPPTVGSRARYEAMLVALDGLLARLLAAVDLDRTLVMVVGDNGTPPDVAPDPLRAKSTTFERGIRVPLVVAGGPVSVPGRRSQRLTHIVDLWATAIEWGQGHAVAPGRTPYPIRARSLLPTLQKQPDKGHDFVIAGSQWGADDGDRCIRTAGGFKLRQVDVDGDRIPEREELYDLVRDPHELRDLSGDPLRARWVRYLRAVLEQHTP